MNHHDENEVAILMAEYRARKMREHMMGPGVSFIFHMCLIIALALLVNGKLPDEEEEPILIVMTPPPEIIDLPPPPPTPQPQIKDLLTPPAPPAPPMPTPSPDPDPGDPNPIPEATSDVPEPESLDLPIIQDVAPIQSVVRIPSSYARRGDRVRSKMIGDGTMPRSGQQAVLRALRWLAKVQSDNGSWEDSPALSGLALLCFLAHGDTPISEEFGLTVQKSMQWLAAAMPADGQPMRGKHGGVYDHGIASYALSEGYGMTQIPMLRTAATNGLTVIVKGQQKGGGWNYNYDDKGRWDLSVSAWQMQALKAGYVAGLDVPGLCDAIKSGRNFTRRSFKSGTFGYSKPGGSTNLTGAGVLCLQILGAADSAEARSGLEHVMDRRRAMFADAHNAFRAQGGPIYGWYYDTQAAFHAGGKRWEAWRKVFVRVLSQNQHPEGYWDIEPRHAVGSPLATDVYHTTLCCLQLEVYYRYLPSMGNMDGPCGEERKVVDLLSEDPSDLIIQ